MTTEHAITATDVWKTYQIYSHRATSLKEMVIKSLFERGEREELHALREVNFTVPWGRSLALVGGNGSGKSTLLKLMSGITFPTQGTLHVHGRTAALLELGAGFQFELTGMENIFLQGAILGLSRGQILERLDDIIAFSELESFIHTPMKRYSSGMTIRLGFALAASSDNEVLLIDEVLSVGDVAFQQKCLDRIADLRREGRTIIFVSHIIHHISNVADDVLWFENGEMRAFGPQEEVLPQYIDAMRAAASNAPRVAVDAGDQRRHKALSAVMPMAFTEGRGAAVRSVRLMDASGTDKTYFRQGDPIHVEIEVDVPEKLDGLEVLIGYSGLIDLRMGIQSTEVNGPKLRDVQGRYRVRAVIEDVGFVPDRYKMTVALGNPFKEWDYYDLHLDVYSFQIRGTRVPHSHAVLTPPGRFAGASAIDSP